MGDFLKSTRFKILLALLIVLVAFMLRAAWNGGLSPSLEQAVGMVVAPFQKASSSIANFVTGYFQRYVRADEVAAENEELREQLNSLRGQLVEFETYKQENETLKQFLGIKEKNPDFQLEPAAVVSRDQSSRFHSFTIDKGYLSGVSVLNPVISPDGLVGRVQEVGANYSKVITILDVSSDVGAYDVRTRDIGTVTGDVALSADGSCRLSYLPRESGATVGDLVVTTGGGLFPKDLTIGEITRVSAEAGGISLYAVIKPAADIANLTDVMVIKSFEGQEKQ